MREKRRVRARPMHAFREMQLAAQRLASAEKNFYGGRQKSGAGILGRAFEFALAKQRVRQRLSLDPKFNIENDARFNERLFDFLRSAKARGRFSFAIVDLDYLKTLNDSRGHYAGDMAIELLVQKLAGIAKARRGFAGRFGGDEFKLLVPADSTVLAKALESALASMRRESFSFSAGVCDSRDKRLGNKALRSHKDVVQRRVEMLNAIADRALYKSKKAGRCRITVS